MALRQRLVWAFLVSLGQVACGSEPLGEPSDEGGGGEAGAGGEAPVDLPDYRDSECWGRAGLTQVYNGMTHEMSDVPATCRAEGERGLIYVADELWENGVDQDAVNAFMHRFELIGGEGSYRPNLGILPTNEEVFGALDPAALMDGKIAVFVVDTHGGGDGYLCSWCDTRELHLDGTLLRPLSGDTALSIVAHESYHAIHRGFDPDEVGWVDESIAQAAMTVNGFFTDLEWLDAFLEQPNVNWGPGASVFDFQYGAGLLFGSYLWERGGPELMRRITSEPQNGWEGIDQALKAVGEGESAWDLFLDMGVATYLDDPDSGFGFESFDLTREPPLRTIDPGDSLSVPVQPYGLVYLRPGDGAQSVAFDTEDATLLGGRVLSGDPPQVSALDPGATLEVSEPTVLVLSASAMAEVTVAVE